MPFLKPSNQSRTELQETEAKRHGLRRSIFSVNGDKYIGEWLDDKKHGKGIQLWKKSGATYDGEWKFGKPDGTGIYSVMLPKSKEYTKKYSGEWKDGKKHGYGTYYYTSEVYEGEWCEDLRSGRGRMRYENGDTYEGEWAKDRCHGQGVMILSNGNRYEGLWENGKKHGIGKFYYLDKGLLYEGFWVEGIAKCGTMTEVGRENAAAPPKYPFPKLHLMDVGSVLRDAESTLQDCHEAENAVISAPSLN